MKDVLTFWMERGVDGFRIDAIDQLFEDDRFLDEPVAYPEIEDHEDPEYLQHIYTKNQPETIDMVQQWREVVDKQSAIDGVERYNNPVFFVRSNPTVIVPARS
jgi:alpha-glucosidase